MLKQQSGEHTPEVTRRHTTKSPGAKKAASTGVRFTEGGEPFISSWPSSRPAFNMKNYPRQSIEEAAQWAVKERGCKHTPAVLNIILSKVLNMEYPHLKKNMIGFPCSAFSAFP